MPARHRVTESLYLYLEILGGLPKQNSKAVHVVSFESLYVFRGTTVSSIYSIYINRVLIHTYLFNVHYLTVKSFQLKLDIQKYKF